MWPKKQFSHIRCKNVISLLCALSNEAFLYFFPSTYSSSIIFRCRIEHSMCVLYKRPFCFQWKVETFEAPRKWVHQRCMGHECSQFIQVSVQLDVSMEKPSRVNVNTFICLTFSDSDRNWLLRKLFTHRIVPRLYRKESTRTRHCQSLMILSGIY